MSEAIHFDTHKFVKRMTETGMSEATAEALADEQLRLIQGELATKTDMAELRAATKRDLAELRSVTKRDLAELRSVTKRDLEELRAATQADIAELRAVTRRTNFCAATQVLSAAQSGLSAAYIPHSPAYA